MDRMTGEITDDGLESLLLRTRSGVFVLERGSGISAGEGARFCAWVCEGGGVGGGGGN